jgi:hypothetical protein
MYNYYTNRIDEVFRLSAVFFVGGSLVVRYIQRANAYYLYNTLIVCMNVTCCGD